MLLGAVYTNEETKALVVENCTSGSEAKAPMSKPKFEHDQLLHSCLPALVGD